MKINVCEPRQMKETPTNPVFGTAFTPHLLKIELQKGKVVEEMEIRPMGEENIQPTISALHYSQSVFEGMKAFRLNTEKVGIFRLRDHAQRFAKSCAKMNMFVLPEGVFEKALWEFVSFEKINVPDLPDHALYIRPLMFATDHKIKVMSSGSYSFYVLACVVGNYFSATGKAAKVMVNKQFVRAFPGGLGDIKAAANYAMGIASQAIAQEHQCDQVLYLDSQHHQFIDELGGMNFFAIRGDELVTPKLNGCILSGITRRSLLELAPEFGLKPVEESLSFDRLAEDIQCGNVTEIFACGTAAVIQPIGELVVIDNMGSPHNIEIPGPYTKSLAMRKALQDIQTGKRPDSYDWLTVI
ncbi:MAG: branched-chain amino acid aminotransferase [Bdellovibrionaceae bacterium]|nr:branched-chain amino acid aminotransferase [Pseudobdellovibrionaceae bacterium]